MTDNRLEALEQRIRRLEDERDIRNLKARYLRSCDLKRPDSVRETLTEDVRIDYEGFPPLDNREAFLSVYEEFGCTPDIFDIHHSGDGIIRFRDDDHASGEWTLTFHNINLAARTLTRFGVQYDDDYVRKNGEWRISRSRSWRTYALVEKVDEAGGTTVIAMGKGPESFGGD